MHTGHFGLERLGCCEHGLCNEFTAFDRRHRTGEVFLFCRSIADDHHFVYGFFDGIRGRRGNGGCIVLGLRCKSECCNESKQQGRFFHGVIFDSMGTGNLSSAIYIIVNYTTTILNENCDNLEIV